MKSAEYIEALKPFAKSPSVYAVAKLLAIPEDTCRGYALGRRYLDIYACLRVAEILNIPLERVIADVALERETDPAKREVWNDLLRKFAAGILMASAIGLVLGGSFHAEHARASTGKVAAADLTRYKLHANKRLYKYSALALRLLLQRLWKRLSICIDEYAPRPEEFKDCAYTSA